MTTVIQPGQLLDHYQIIRLLGRGGASRVYLARDVQTKQEVVLKFPTDDLVGGAAIFARYLREAEIGRRLSHPAIQCHLYPEEQRSADYLVLEYLQGYTLREAMHKYVPELLPQEQAMQIMSQVCSALAYVHEQGVIHQDIKPDNIFLLEDGEIKLLDFGIAQIGKGKRQWGGFSTLIGTPDYMAPERLEGKAGTVRSDVYAVGVMLYELLCGRTPFQETDGFALVSEHISHDPLDILSHNPTLSPALTTVVMRAIRRDPDKRYASVQELQHDLCHLDQVRPLAYVPDPPRVGGRYRQIVYIALIILAICLLLVALGVLAQIVHHVGP